MSRALPVALLGLCSGSNVQAFSMPPATSVPLSARACVPGHRPLPSGIGPFLWLARVCLPLGTYRGPHRPPSLPPCHLAPLAPAARHSPAQPSMPFPELRSAPQALGVSVEMWSQPPAWCVCTARGLDLWPEQDREVLSLRQGCCLASVPLGHRGRCCGHRSDPAQLSRRQVDGFWLG